MSIILKPLMALFAHPIEGTEPQIVTLDAPMPIIGLAMQTSTKRVYRDVPRLGKQFQAHRDSIPGKKQPWAFAAVTTDFDPETHSFTYIMGDVVTGTQAIPEGLIAFDIPAGTYAVFPVRPRNRFGWAPAIISAKKYAYNTWLPRSGYRAAGIIDDFEYHDVRSLDKRNPQIDLYVAVTVRS